MLTFSPFSRNESPCLIASDEYLEMVSDSNESVVSMPLRKRTDGAFANSSLKNEPYSNVAEESESLQHFNAQVTMNNASKKQSVKNHVENGHECNLDDVFRSVQAHILRGEMLQIRQPAGHRYA